jgi:hypothetical protein
MQGDVRSIKLGNGLQGRNWAEVEQVLPRNVTSEHKKDEAEHTEMKRNIIGLRTERLSLKL